MANESIEFTPEEQVQLLRKQKAQLERQRERYRARALIALGFAVVGGLTGVALTVPGGDPASVVTLFALGGAGGATLFYLSIVAYLRMILGLLMRPIDRELLRAGAAALQQNIEQDFVTKLIQINFKYIDQYYEQTQSQANKSFLLSAFASLVGLGIIAVGISMMFRGLVEPAYVTTAAGVASEFIAAVFFYLYNRTISKMSDYHDKLVVTQNISLALKIAEGLEGSEKSDAHRLLIDRLSEKVNQYLTQQTSGG